MSLALLYAGIAGPEPARSQAPGGVVVPAVHGQNALDVNLPEMNSAAPIAVTADTAMQWNEGGYEVWLLQGNCRIEQGQGGARSQEAVLWIDRASSLDHGRTKVIAYLEGQVIVDFPRQGGGARLTDNAWLGRFLTAASVQVQVVQTNGQGRPQAAPPVYQRAQAARMSSADSPIRQTAYQAPVTGRAPGTVPGGVAPAGRAPGAAPSALAAVVGPAPSGGVSLPPGTRLIRVDPRSDAPVQVQWFPDRQTNQWIGVVDGGVTLVIYGMTVPASRGPLALGPLDISTDRLVIWTRGTDEMDLTGTRPQHEDVPLEIYMEGNIVFRQGDRVINAERMYYDVRNQVGTVVRGELLTPVPQYEGLLRLRAEVLQQLGPNRFFARDAFLTSSRMGEPGYRLQVGNLSFEDQQQAVTDPFTGVPLKDPQTDEPLVTHDRLFTAQNNLLYLDHVPLFYWPSIATDLTESSFFLRRIRFKTDSIFGFQVLTDWNMYQLLGIRNRPAGTEWDLSLDYLSKRGFGHGTTFSYHRNDFLGVEGPASGLIDYWGIEDHGTDNLGRDRREVPPEKDYRFRLFAQHRQMLAGEYQLSVEAGWISDRNFLEEYFQREWDEMKDEDTGLDLKKITDNSSWSLSAYIRANSFFTDTEWLPRFDHYLLGQSLVNDTFTWYEHTSVGYAQFKTLTRPEDTSTPFQYLPWETGLLADGSSSGVPLSTSSERLITRHELDWPFQMGPVKFVPYALGEVAHWGEDRTGDDLQRAYAQAGVRASIPFWRVDPTVRSSLFNVNGLAHKIVFDAEFAWTDANRNLDQLPLYEPLDDNSIEAFRRRFIPNTFPGPGIPTQFDERYYAVRTGMAGWVTSPSMETVEDLMAFRLGMQNRWQTKRGAPGHERSIDWVTLDTNLVLFPKPDRDDFGEVLGLLDYDLRWQVGDRLALLSSGAFDFFQDGQRVVTFGGFLDRPPRGGLYVGVRYLDGPIHNVILATSFTYRMSPKWVGAFGATLDLQDSGNIGQNLSVTRVGESFLVSTGVSYNASLGSWGAHLSIEPRFLPKTRLGQAGGARIPVAGSTGLE